MDETTRITDGTSVEYLFFSCLFFPAKSKKNENLHHTIRIDTNKQTNNTKKMSHPPTEKQVKEIHEAADLCRLSAERAHRDMVALRAAWKRVRLAEEAERTNEYDCDCEEDMEHGDGDDDDDDYFDVEHAHTALGKASAAFEKSEMVDRAARKSLMEELQSLEKQHITGVSFDLWFNKIVKYLEENTSTHLIDRNGEVYELESKGVYRRIGYWDPFTSICRGERLNKMHTIGDLFGNQWPEVDFGKNEWPQLVVRRLHF